MNSKNNLNNICNLSILDIPPQTETKAIVIWLHGLGASANDFEPVLPIINKIAPGIRYLFPNAPLMSVSVNGGMMMPAWYDIISPDLSQGQDIKGINDSCDKLECIVSSIRKEIGDEIPIILAGFSQGGVIALTTALTRQINIQGALVLSAYLPSIEFDENHTENDSKENKKDINILMMHGTDDPVIPIAYAKESFSKLPNFVSKAHWEEFPMDHSLCFEEVEKIGEWLKAY